MLNESLEKFCGAGGYTCLSIFNEDIGVDWKDNFFKSVYETNGFINENKNINNCYLSIATYTKPWRTEENIDIIMAHYIDIDNHISPFSLKDAKQFELLFLRGLYESVIPTPSQVLYTGRGLQLIFNLKGARDIPKFKQTQRALNETLQKQLNEDKNNVLLDIGNGLKIDNLTDVRVLRVANTINTKSGTYSQVIFKSNAIYTQDEIIKRYGWLEYVTGTKKKEKHQLKELIGANSKEILKYSDNEIKSLKPYNKLYTFETISLFRRKDLKKLIELRNAKGYTQGYRNKLIKIAVQLIREYVTDTKELYRNLQGFNFEFKEPLKDNEIIAWCNSAIKKQIYFRTETIIKELDITEEEQEHLSVIVSHKIRNKRYSNKHKEEYRQKRNERYKPVKMANKKKKQKRNKKVLSLIKKGVTYEQIGLNLGITTRTIINIKKNSIQK
jgi:DNA-binding CsgD family transcriptional regulator